MAIVVAFAVMVTGIALAWRPSGADIGALGMTLGLGVGLAFLGLLDDLKDLAIWPRLLVEVAAGVVVYWTGTRADVSGVPGSADLVLTVLWVVGITNAFNLLDNVDGLSAGVAAIAALAMAGVGLVNDQYFVPLLALALAGCAAGFLRLNFHPARIHMGDAGSLFLGFVLGVLALRLRAHTAHQVSFAVPLVALAVPILDTGLVATTRAWERLNPFRGRRDHISHRLVALGWSVPGAVGAIYAVAAACGALAIGLTRVGRGVGFAVAGSLAGLAVLAGAGLARVPVPVPGATDAPGRGDLNDQ
ncbi:MAG: MraY family glycosyltransferase [Acidimicrobiales bacterium]